jgi:hypothetical protein
VVEVTLKSVISLRGEYCHVRRGAILNRISSNRKLEANKPKSFDQKSRHKI